jgi:hypothetical protein
MLLLNACSISQPLNLFETQRWRITMKAYRTYLTVTDAKQVVLSDLPFQPGQVVEVLVLAQDADRALALSQLDALLQRTQALPQVQELTDDEIAAEVAAYRNGQ